MAYAGIPQWHTPFGPGRFWAGLMRVLVRVKKEPVRRFCRTLSMLCLVAGVALGLFELLAAFGDQSLFREEALRPAIVAAVLVFLTGLLVSRVGRWAALQQKAEEPKIDIEDLIRRLEFDEHSQRFRASGG